MDDVAGISGMGLALSGASLSRFANGGAWEQLPNTWGSGDYRYLYADADLSMATGGATFSLWSADGLSWERIYHPTWSLGRIAKGDQRLYALSPDPNNVFADRILDSQDGREWSALPISLPDRGVSVIGQSGTLLTFHEKGEVMLGVPLVSPTFQTDLLASGYPFDAALSPAADANGDGIPNMVARYFGLNIMTPNPGGIQSLPRLEVLGAEEEEMMLYIPTSRGAASYMRLAIESCENLKDWIEVAVLDSTGSWVCPTGGTVSEDGDGGVMLSLPSSSASRFFRMKIEEKP